MTSTLLNTRLEREFEPLMSHLVSPYFYKYNRLYYLPCELSVRLCPFILPCLRSILKQTWLSALSTILISSNTFLCLRRGECTHSLIWFGTIYNIWNHAAAIFPISPLPSMYHVTISFHSFKCLMLNQTHTYTHTHIHPMTIMSDLGKILHSACHSAPNLNRNLKLQTHIH